MLAVALVAWLTALRHGVLATAELPASVAPPVPAAWPVLSSADEPVALEFPIRGFFPRGSLRIESALEDLHSPTLVLVSNDGGAARLLERSFDYSSPGSWEYYGLAAGERVGFVRCGERTSELFRVAVERGALATVHVEHLEHAGRRELEIRAAGERAPAGATVLLTYDGFELLEPWRGEPLALQRPLASPKRVTVRAHDDRSGAPNLGVSQRVADGDGDGPIVVELGRGRAVLTLAAWDMPRHPDAAYADEFAISATPALAVLTPSAHGSPLLACVRDEEFEIPPTIHSWAKGQPEGPATIHGLSSGRHRIAAGLEGRGRYTLWRATEVDDGALIAARLARVSDLAPAPEHDRLRLPGWIASFAATDALNTSSRERQLHPAGPSEVWRRIDRDESTLVHRAGWRTGDGAEFTAATVELAIELPESATGQTRELTLRVEAPDGGVNRTLAWEFSATRVEAGALSLEFVPDGTLAGRIALLTGEVLTCNARIVDGNWESRPSWTRPEEARGLAPVVEASAGRTRAREAEALATEVTAFDRIGRELGCDLASLGIESVSLLGHPGGEEREFSPGDGGFVDFAEQVVEVRCSTPRLALWGLMRTCEQPQASNGARVSVSIVNRSRPRTLRLTLASAELVLELRPGEMRTVNLAAPARVALLSVVRAGASSTPAPEEGVEIELRADDVLVVDYE